MIYTFYSYKGGVGRTMALANIAELFARQGMRVLMIDWDLEAPGLEQFFFPAEQLETVRERRGLMDLLLTYKEQMTQKLDLSDEENLPFEKPGSVALDIYPKASGAGGSLRLITAGRRSRSSLGDYAGAVLSFDWKDFYENWLGEAYFDWFRRECEKQADTILIDSRTGLTEIGGVCTYHLADIVVLLCAANNQNISGTLEMVQNFSQPNVITVRGGRPLKTLVVPSRIDTVGEIELLNEFRQKLVRTFSSYSKIVRDDPGIFERITIPYMSSYAFEERIAVKQAERSGYYAPDLIKAYEQLSQTLQKLGQEVVAAWQRKITDVTQEWERLGQRFAEVTKAKILETRVEEKFRLNQEMEQLEQERFSVEQTLGKLDREFRHYLK